MVAASHLPALLEFIILSNTHTLMVPWRVGPGSYNTHTHTLLSVVVKTGIGRIHSLVPDSNLNHHNKMSNPNLYLLPDSNLFFCLKPKGPL